MKNGRKWVGTELALIYDEIIKPLCFFGGHYDKRKQEERIPVT